MSARGEPFRGDGHPRRLRRLYCPWCGEEMSAKFIAALGHREPDDQDLATPYYRYICASHGAVEVHRGEVVEGGARGG